MTRLSPGLDPCEYYTAGLPCFFLSDGYAGPIATLSYHEESNHLRWQAGNLAPR